MLKRLSHFFKNIDRKDYRPKFGGLEILKFLGPGLLVTVGFIDPETGPQIWVPGLNLAISYFGWLPCLQLC